MTWQLWYWATAIELPPGSFSLYLKILHFFLDRCLYSIVYLCIVKAIVNQ